MSLLYSNYADANLLRGKTVPLEVTAQALQKFGALGPASCGWNYVEGLTESDSPEIAIVWDKVGLGHFGQRLSRGQEAIYVDGSAAIISAQNWQRFLSTQQSLLHQRSEPDM